MCSGASGKVSSDTGKDDPLLPVDITWCDMIPEAASTRRTRFRTVEYRRIRNRKSCYSATEPWVN